MMVMMAIIMIIKTFMIKSNYYWFITITVPIARYTREQ